NDGVPRPLSELPVPLDAKKNLGSQFAPRFEQRIELLPATVPPRPSEGDGGSTSYECEIARGAADGEGDPHGAETRALARVSGRIAWLDVLAPAGIKVACVAGQDRTIVAALRALGVPHVVLAPDQLAAAELDAFTNLVLDLRTLGAS